MKNFKTQQNKVAEGITNISYGIIKKNNLPLPSYFSTLEKNAMKRKIKFEIIYDDLVEQLKKQNWKCYYTGQDLNFSKENRDGINTPSVDRLDSKLGYTRDNIVWCKTIVNFMKQNQTFEDFIQFCLNVVVHNSWRWLEDNQEHSEEIEILGLA